MEAPIKFITVLHNIIKGQKVSTGPQRYRMKNDILLGEALKVF